MFLLLLLIIGFVICAFLSLNQDLLQESAHYRNIDFTVIDKFTTEPIIPGKALTYNSSKYGYYLRLESQKEGLRILIDDSKIYSDAYLGSLVTLSCSAEITEQIEPTNFKSVSCSLVEHLNN